MNYFKGTEWPLFAGYSGNSTQLVITRKLQKEQCVLGTKKKEVKNDCTYTKREIGDILHHMNKIEI